MWQDIKNIYHLSLAKFAKIYFRNPSKGMVIIGVTGTDGKTTTTNLIYHILQSSGRKTAMLSTIGAAIGNVAYDTGFHVTTPSPIAVQMYINKAKRAGMEYLILETTSHALHQNRVHGISFALSVLTNISHEHLDYHKTYDNYVRAKARLFLFSKKSILNKDDASYPLVTEFLEQKKYQGEIKTYGIYQASDVSPETIVYKSTLLGDFNTYNTLAAISVAKELGIDDFQIQQALESFIPPAGRQEVVYDKDFTVMIDFAHTPNAFEQLLKAVKKEKSGRVIHVFGSAGARDFTKRPKMGEISASYADVIILTSEDPRGEKIEKIMDEIEAGMSDKKPEIIRIADRSEAIQKAIEIAKKDDIVLLTGKGHEKAINYDGEHEIPWDEKAEVLQALAQYGKK